MSALLALIASPAARWLGYLAAGAACIAAIWWGVHTHDRAVRAELLAEQHAEAVVQMQRQHQASITALQSAADDAAELARRRGAAHQEIARAPVTMACLPSPAIRVAIDRVRDLTAAAAAGTAPRQPADLSARPTAPTR
jgi:hypothetical protein